MLLTPWAVRGGAMRNSPASLGEALVALRDNALTTGWQSSQSSGGLGLDVYVDD
jgi:hypothetical protein